MTDRNGVELNVSDAVYFRCCTAWVPGFVAKFSEHDGRAVCTDTGKAAGWEYAAVCYGCEIVKMPNKPPEKVIP